MVATVMMLRIYNPYPYFISISVQNFTLRSSDNLLISYDYQTENLMHILQSRHIVLHSSEKQYINKVQYF